MRVVNCSCGMVDGLFPSPCFVPSKNTVLVATTVLKGVVAAGAHQFGNQFAQLVQIESVWGIRNVSIDLAGQVRMHTLHVGFGAVTKQQDAQGGFEYFNVQFVGIECRYDTLGDLVGTVTGLLVKGKIVHETPFHGPFGTLDRNGQALLVVIQLAFVKGLNRHGCLLFCSAFSVSPLSLLHLLFLAGSLTVNSQPSLAVA